MGVHCVVTSSLKPSQPSQAPRLRAPVEMFAPEPRSEATSALLRRQKGLEFGGPATPGGHGREGPQRPAPSRFQQNVVLPKGAR